jgi:Mg2+ and Co2+ transporter CorA
VARIDDGKTEVFFEHFSQQVDEMNNLAEATRSHARTMVDMLAQDINLRMSSTLFVLSLVSVIFLPLTFVAGVYG